MVRCGGSYQGLAWQSSHGRAGLGIDCLGKASLGGAGVVRYGKARNVESGRVWAVESGLGLAGPVRAGSGEAVKAWCARHVWAC